MSLKQYKSFLLPLIIFLGVVLSGFFILKPKIAQILDFQRDFASQKEKLAQLTIKATFLEGLDQVELEEKTKIVLRALPADKNLADGLSAIRNLSSTAGLELSSVQVEPGEIASETAKPSQKKYNLSFLEFKITLKGTLSQFKDFLRKIEMTAPLMQVTTVSISQKEDQSAEIGCNLDIFFLPLPSTLGTVEKPILPISPQEEEVYRQLVKMTPVQTEPFTPLQSGKENPFNL